MSERRPIVVAIDGPAGAGKSTTSRRVAEALGYVLLDTGALYRCVGLMARAVIDSPERVAEIARAMAEREAIRFQPLPGQGGQRVLLDGQDVSTQIRTQEVSELASQASAIPAVREALLDLQRSAGRAGGVVVEGRDIGTVVFPQARAKFFLTASVEERARRRFDELKHSDPNLTQQRVEEQVRQRDRRDSMRPVAPLKQAPDAELVDSTELSPDEVVARIVARVRQLEAEAAQGEA